METVHVIANKVIDNVEKVIIGKREKIEQVVIALLCQGHILIEDVPGVGKTMLAKSIAKSIGGAFQRLQFTPDLVLATQNPIEYEGTFPLPEAQLDRFMLRIGLGYPSPADEIKMLDSQQRVHPVETLGQAITVEELLAAQEAVRSVHIDDQIKEYIVELVNTSRKHPDIYLGASPRGSLALYKTAQAKAALEERDYVIPDDVKDLALAALAHRLIISPAARIKNVDTRSVVQEILDAVPVPGTRARPRR
jgi:MoxR-like ATPase